MSRRSVKEMTKGTNRKTKKGSKGKMQSEDDELNETPKWGADDLLLKAEEFVETYQPELAQKFYEKGLTIDPNHTQLMDSYAQFLLDMDDFVRAKELLIKSVQISPSDNWMKYMNLGQLLQGGEALQCYNKGIELMLQNREKIQNGKVPSEEGELQSLNQEIASALCSQAELFMTDACFEENAESECEKYLLKALEIDSSNAETLQTLANFKMCQQQPEEALKLLNQSYILWKDLDDLQRPSMEFCHNAAKMFLELEEDRTAADIWETLLDVDDNIAEVHYHLGLAYRYISTEAAKECFHKARELLLQCQDPQLLKQVEDMLTQIEKENYQEEEEDEESTKQGSDDDSMDV